LFAALFFYEIDSENKIVFILLIEHRDSDYKKVIQDSFLNRVLRSTSP